VTHFLRLCGKKGLGLNHHFGSSELDNWSLPDYNVRCK